ncbi:MAG TPA: hypothetical protein VF476_17405 [Chitinophagaceae bacterium]
MKKKETFWELLKRLDEDAGRFNFHLQKANDYFDTTASTTKNILGKHEQRVQSLIKQIQRALQKQPKKKNK